MVRSSVVGGKWLGRLVDPLRWQHVMKLVDPVRRKWLGRHQGNRLMIQLW